MITVCGTSRKLAERSIGGNHRIHPPDQPFGKRLVIALCGRREDQPERGP